MNTYLPGNKVLDAYGGIQKFMEENDFDWMQGSVYFGNSKIKSKSNLT